MMERTSVGLTNVVFLVFFLVFHAAQAIHCKDGEVIWNKNLTAKASETTGVFVVRLTVHGGLVLCCTSPSICNVHVVPR